MTSKTVHVYFNTLSFMLRTCSVRKQKDITSAKAVDLTVFREAFLGYPDKVQSGTSKPLTRTSNAIRVLFIIRPINFASFLYVQSTFNQFKSTFSTPFNIIEKNREVLFTKKKKECDNWKSVQDSRRLCRVVGTQQKSLHETCRQLSLTQLISFLTFKTKYELTKDIIIPLQSMNKRTYIIPKDLILNHKALPSEQVYQSYSQLTSFNLCN